PYGSTLLRQIPRCEVVNLHWISGFVDYAAFFNRVPQSTPVVWTLHDLNPMTGGGHYGLGCGRFVLGCGVGPQVGSEDSADLSHDVWERKSRALSRVSSSRLHFVAPSRWVADEVKRSSIFQRFPVTVIPHGLDLEEYSPRDRTAARELLGIPRDA